MSCRIFLLNCPVQNSQQGSCFACTLFLLLPVVFTIKTMHFFMHFYMGCMPAWVMFNGPCWCNRLNYYMRCPTWILKRQLIHELSEKFFARRKKSMHVIYSKTKTLSAICSISKWTIYSNAWNWSQTCMSNRFQTVCCHTTLWPAQLFKVEWIQITLWAKWHKL